MGLGQNGIFAVERLREFSARVFRHFGVPEEDARQAAEVLAAADLRGVDSHGVARLHTYVDMLALGRINPRPNVQIIRELPGTATVDGDNGLGLVVGPRANAVALEKGDLITLREQRRRTSHTARLFDVYWWLLRCEADKARMEKLRERKKRH